MIDIETMQHVYAMVIEEFGREDLIVDLTPQSMVELDRLVVKWYQQQGYSVKTVDDVWIRENQHQRVKLGKIMKLTSFIREPNGEIIKIPFYTYQEAVQILYQQIVAGDGKGHNLFAKETTIVQLQEQQLVQFFEMQGHDITYYIYQIDAIQYPENY